MLNAFSKVAATLITVGQSGATQEVIANPLSGATFHSSFAITRNVEEPFSKQLKKAMSALHEEASNTVFAKSALDGVITADQYNLFLKQRIAMLEVVDNTLYNNPNLPKNLQQFFGANEHKMIVGLKKDLGMKDNETISTKDLLPETVEVINMLRRMNHYELAVIGYTISGETAFGVQDLAQKLNEKNINNTDGLTSYKILNFLQLVKRMNSTTTDPATQTQMIEAGRKFYKAIIIANNSKHWAPK